MTYEMRSVGGGAALLESSTLEIRMFYWRTETCTLDCSVSSKGGTDRAELFILLMLIICRPSECGALLSREAFFPVSQWLQLTDWGIKRSHNQDSARASIKDFHESVPRL
jgi:hypothetical protein